MHAGVAHLPILYEKSFNLKLPGIEDYYIFKQKLIKNMLCSKLHCQKDCNLIILSYKISGVVRTSSRQRLVMQPAPAPRLAPSEGYAALRIVLVTVPRVSRSCEHSPDGFDLHLYAIPATLVVHSTRYNTCRQSPLEPSHPRQARPGPDPHRCRLEGVVITPIPPAMQPPNRRYMKRELTQTFLVIELTTQHVLY